jgi:hypothetical protein
MSQGRFEEAKKSLAKLRLRTLEEAEDDPLIQVCAVSTVLIIRFIYSSIPDRATGNACGSSRNSSYTGYCRGFKNRRSI